MDQILTNYAPTMNHNLVPFPIYDRTFLESFVKSRQRLFCFQPEVQHLKLLFLIHLKRSVSINTLTS